MSMEGEITGPPRDVAGGKWVLGRGNEILCSCKIYGMRKNKLGVRKKLREYRYIP